jgi:hypothetical protein
MALRWDTFLKLPGTKAARTVDEDFGRVGEALAKSIPDPISKPHTPQKPLWLAANRPNVPVTQSTADDVP